MDAAQTGYCISPYLVVYYIGSQDDGICIIVFSSYMYKEPFEAYVVVTTVGWSEYLSSSALLGWDT